jgi:hypothetical protein
MFLLWISLLVARWSGFHHHIRYEPVGPEPVRIHQVAAEQVLRKY